MTTELQRDKNETLLLLRIFYFLAGAGLFFYEEKAGMPKSSGIIIFNESVSLQELYINFANLFSVLFLLRWFVLDARQRGFKIPALLIALIIISNTIGTIIYFVKTRKKQDAGPVILKGVRFVLSCVVLAVFGYLLTAVSMGP